MFRKRKLRKIRVKLLLGKTIVYRLFISVVQIFLTYLYMKMRISSVPLSVLAIEMGILWNILNTFLYFLYDYIFCRLFVIGKNKGRQDGE